MTHEDLIRAGARRDAVERGNKPRNPVGTISAFMRRCDPDRETFESDFAQAIAELGLARCVQIYNAELDPR